MQKVIDGVKSVLFGLVLFAAPLFFFTDFSKNPYNIQTVILVCSCACLFIVWSLEIFVTKHIHFKNSRADFFFGCFVIVALLSVYYNYMEGMYPAATLGEFVRRGSVLITNGVFAYLLARQAKDVKPLNILWLVPVWGLAWFLYPTFKMSGYIDIYAIILWAAALYFCFLYLRNLSIKAFLNIFIAVGFLASCYGLLQYFGFDFFWKQNALQGFGARAVSTFGNPNFLSSYLVMILPLAVVFCITSKQIYNRIFYFASCLLFTAYLVVSMTRSSWAGAGVALAVLLLSIPFWIEGWKHKKVTIALIVSIFFVFFLWPTPGGEGYSSATINRVQEGSLKEEVSKISLDVKAEDINQSYHQRLMMWKCSVEAAKKSPLIGLGWGSFQLNYAECQGDILKSNPDLKPLMTQANGAHNMFFEVLAESGIIGLAFFVLLLGSIIFIGIYRIQKAPEKKKIVMIALLAGIAGMLTDNLLNITLQTNITSFVFWWLVSTLLTYDTEQKSFKVSPLISMLVVIAVLLVGGLMINWQVRNAVGDKFEHKANKLYVEKNYPLAALNMQKSLHYKKYNAEGYDLLINSQIRQRNLQAAFDTAETALDYYPNYYELYFKRGVLHHSFEENEKAIVDFRKVLALNPNYMPALSFVATYFYEKPETATDEDLAIFLDAAALMPYLLDFNYVSSKIYYAKGNPYRARELITELLRKETLNDDYMNFLKEINQELGIKYDDVIAKAANLRKARNIMIFTKKATAAQIMRITGAYPGDVTSAILLGEFYFKKNMYDKAIETLLSVYEGNEQTFSLNFALSSAYAAKGEKAKAAEYLNKILELDEFNEVAQQRLLKLQYK